MNWLTKQWKKLVDLINGFPHADKCNLHKQDIAEAAQQPESQCPSNQELKNMKMPELRELAASRHIPGPYKGVDRNTLTKLIKESY